MDSLDSATILNAVTLTTRQINLGLQQVTTGAASPRAVLLSPQCRHNLAVGLTGPLHLTIEGPVGYYCGGLCEEITLEIHGGCGWALGENLMSGTIQLHGNAGSATASCMRGGLIVVHGECGARAGIGMTGGTLLITGNAGLMAGTALQGGTIIICGDAGPALGDEMRGGQIFLYGEAPSLGKSARYVPLQPEDEESLSGLLCQTGQSYKLHQFKKIVSTANFLAAFPGQATLLMTSLPPFAPAGIRSTPPAPPQGSRLPSLADLTFLPAGLTRVALGSGYEACATHTVLGTRYAAEPLQLSTPILAKGNMPNFYRCLPGRQGFNPTDLRKADAVEMVVSQALSPAGTPARHPDWMGPEDLALKIEELREATHWRPPIFVTLAASRVLEDVRLAVGAGADGVIIEGLEAAGLNPQTGQRAAQGLPLLAVLPLAARALAELGLAGQVQLIACGGMLDGNDAARALALGADAVLLKGAPDAATSETQPCPCALGTWTQQLQAVAASCGKSHTSHLDTEDLRALTLEAALITGLPLVGMRESLRGWYP